MGMVLAGAAATLAVRPAAGQSPTQETGITRTLLDSIGFDQKLNAQVPPGLTFRDETGRTVQLGDYMGKRPVILSLVYYNCPMLCTQVLNGLTRSLKPLAFELGRDFDMVTVSIDPSEGPELSALKKRSYLKVYGRGGKRAEAGWHFLTGTEAEIRRLAQTVGFRYTYNPKTRLYAHAAGITLLTPKGRVARYLFGIDFPPRDMQFGLMEASAGKIGSPIARVMLLCYDYDAAAGKYTMSIMKVTRILGSATAIGLATTVVLLLRRERRLKARLGGLGVQTPLPTH